MSNGNLHPADELGRLQHGSYELPARERELSEILIADREARVGEEFVAIVREREEGLVVGTVVDCERLPDLHKVLQYLQQGVMIVDTETTGLYPARGDRIVSVAALGARVGWSIECTGDEVDGYLVMTDSFRWEVHETGRYYYRKINPGRASSAGALRIHGLTDLTAEATFPDIAADLEDFLKYEVFVAHNAPFDDEFLLTEFQRAGRPGPTYEDIVDTRVISKMIWPDQSGSLDALAKRLGVDRGSRDERHDALDDCRLLARCLPGLVQAIKEHLAKECK